MNLILHYLIVLIHCILPILGFYLALTTKNKNLLLIIIFLCILIVYQWVIFGECLLNYIENKLINIDNSESQINILISRVFNINKQTVNSFITIIPLMISSIALWRLKK